MSSGAKGRPGFHAIMMAAAYAEEGLGDHARAVLEEGARERAGAPAGEASGIRAWLRAAGEAKGTDLFAGSRK